MPVITQPSAVYEWYLGTTYVNTTLTGQPYKDYGGGRTLGGKTVTDASGNRPMKPYVRWVDEYVAFTGSVRVDDSPTYSPIRYLATRSGGLEGTGVNRFPQTVRDSSAWVENAGLANKVLIKALLDLKGVNVNVPMMYMERQRTADLFTKNVTKVANAYRSLRKGRWKAAAAHLGVKIKKAPKNWLELQYGWKPLLSDAYNAAALLSEYENGTDSYVVTVRAKGEDGRKYQMIHNPPANTEHYGIDYTEKHRCKVVLRYKPADGTIRTLAQCGVTNPLLLAWELLPFSFVLDWAYPLGDYLSCLDAAAGWKFHSGCRTITRRKSGKSWAKVKKYNGLLWTPIVTGGKHYRMYMTREVFSASPLPTMPPFKNPASTSHVASALALLKEVFVGDENPLNANISSTLRKPRKPRR